VNLHNKKNITIFAPLLKAPSCDGK
jgi:hypothetical protein